MPPLAIFLVLLVGSLVVARLRRWPLGPALLEAAGSATALTLVVFGEDLPQISYVVKATLIALGAGSSMWVIARMYPVVSTRDRFLQANSEQERREDDSPSRRSPLGRS
jgi:hypothetical protein